MFNLLYFLFEIFRNKIFSETINNPLRVDLQDWIPDFAKQFGEVLKDSFQKFIDRVKGFFDWLSGEIYGYIESVIETLKGFAQGVTNLITSFWSYLQGWLQGFLDYVYDILGWLGDCLYDTYEFFVDIVTNLWDLVCKTFEALWGALQDLLWYIGEWLFEFVLACGDSLVGLCIDMVLWLFDKVLPAIDMPQGFEQGVTNFIQFGMLLNEILPIRESLSLFALYITIRVGLGVFRFVKSMPYKLMLGSFGG
jgi:hypothetical protein